MTTVFVLSGKASRVFRLLRLLATVRGETKIGDLR